MRLLLTRPDADSDRTAAALRARGHEVVIMPLMRIEPVADANLGAGPWAAVVATSANACRAVADHRRIAALRALPFFAVGARTAQAAGSAGFSAVTAAHGGVDELAYMVASRVSDTRCPVLYLAGEERAGDLAGLLGRQGLTVQTVVMYRAVMANELPAAVRAGLSAGEIDGVLHFSARSAQAFLAALAAAHVSITTLNIQHFCLSAQVAAPLQAAGATNCRIAARPNERDLVDLPGS